MNDIQQNTVEENVSFDTGFLKGWSQGRYEGRRDEYPKQENQVDNNVKMQAKSIEIAFKRKAKLKSIHIASRMTVDPLYAIQFAKDIYEFLINPA